MSLSEVKAKDRHSAQEGDITGFYGNRREKFKLFVALG